MAYIVEIIHHKPVYRNGDLENDLETTTHTFSKRKEAKEFIENRLSKLKNVRRGYHRESVEPSICIGWTGKKWTNENTGEECEEHYKFYLQKE